MKHNNNVKWWVNTTDFSSSPSTIHIALSGFHSRANLLGDWNGRCWRKKGSGTILLHLHHMKPPFHGWLTWWGVIRGLGKRCIDMANNIHYVSVTLSYLLINFLLAVIWDSNFNPLRDPWESLQSTSQRDGTTGLANTADTQLHLRWSVLLKTNISVCFSSEMCLSLSQLAFIDHSPLPNAICLLLFLTHIRSYYCKLRHIHFQGFSFWCFIVHGMSVCACACVRVCVGVGVYMCACVNHRHSLQPFIQKGFSWVNISVA